MSKIFELEEKIKNDLSTINLSALKENARNVGYLHDRLIPMINEVVMSATNCNNYEDAYKAVIDSLRALHEKIAMEKNNADTLLLTSAGKLETLSNLQSDIKEIADSERDKIRSERVNDIAEKIQSGSYNPDAIRKVGQKPESLKNIRAAKKTLFGSSPSQEPSHNEED